MFDISYFWLIEFRICSRKVCLQPIIAASVYCQLLLVFVKEFSKLIYFPHTYSLIQSIFCKAFC